MILLLVTLVEHGHSTRCQNDFTGLESSRMWRKLYVHCISIITLCLTFTKYLNKKKIILLLTYNIHNSPHIVGDVMGAVPTYLYRKV